MSYKSYRDDANFLKFVSENRVFAIKSNLEGLIVKLKGNKEKCDEAVQYAIDNSDFNWEKDDGFDIGKKPEINKREEYFYEKGRLVQNFTKERYEKVIELYKEFLKENEIRVENEEKKTKNQTTSTVKSPKGIKGTRGMDQEEKTVLIRTTLLISTIVIILFMLIKAIF